MTDAKQEKISVPVDRYGFPHPRPQDLLMWLQLRNGEIQKDMGSQLSSGHDVYSKIMLVGQLFFGWLETRNGKTLQRHFGDSRCSVEEKKIESKALQAVSDLLCLPNPPRFVLDGLAMLFDQEKFCHQTDRTVQLKFRSRRRRDHYRDTSIAERVLALRLDNVRPERALEITAGEFALSPEAVRTIWRRYQRVFPERYRQKAVK